MFDRAYNWVVDHSVETPGAVCLGVSGWWSSCINIINLSLNVQDFFLQFFLKKTQLHGHGPSMEMQFPKIMPSYYKRSILFQSQLNCQAKEVPALFETYKHFYNTLSAYSINSKSYWDLLKQTTIIIKTYCNTLKHAY